MEDNLKGIQPQWKTTSIEDDLKGRTTVLKNSLMDVDLNGSLTGSRLHKLPYLANFVLSLAQLSPSLFGNYSNYIEYFAKDFSL